jgi:CheY-like chemotaxis protein
MFKILIVEDHLSFRETLKAYLRDELSWVILEEGANFFTKGEATGRDILAFVKPFQLVNGSGG